MNFTLEKALVKPEWTNSIFFGVNAFAVVPKDRKSPFLICFRRSHARKLFKNVENALKINNDGKGLIYKNEFRFWKDTNYSLYNFKIIESFEHKTSLYQVL